MATFFELINQLDKTVQTFEHALWAPVFWTPLSGTDERFMVAIAVQLGESKKVLRIVDNHVLKVFYRSENKRASNIIDYIVDYLNSELKLTGSINNLISYSENFTIGKTREIAAPNLTEATLQIIQSHSSIVTKQSYLDMIRAQETIKDNDWSKTVKNYCRNIFPEIGEFDKKISVGDRSIGTFFNTFSEKFVALSLQLSSDKQIPTLCMKARDSIILLNNPRIERVLTVIKREAETEEIIDRFQFEQSAIGARPFDCWIFEHPMQLPDFFKEEARMYA